jgi:hypothetical protein|tara:strand:+ start:327 stop:563 length:237 start_codon:yes stop_codon:yes gene_type:complete
LAAAEVVDKRLALTEAAAIILRSVALPHLLAAAMAGEIMITAATADRVVVLDNGPTKQNMADQEHRGKETLVVILAEM